ncbi:MAG: hypothetical protein WCI45_01130 [Desulfuromonadales bacterium]
MKILHCFCVVCAISLFSATFSFAEDAMPEYMLKAQSLIAQANTKAAGYNDFSDAVLIGQNYLRRAETEYKKNQSWGKLDKKAESTVRYYTDMACLQASIVLSQVGKIEQEKEQIRLEALTLEVKAKVRVFDDKKAVVSALKVDLVKRDAIIADLQAVVVSQKKLVENKQSEIDRLTGNITQLTADLSAKGTVLTATEARNSEGAQELKVKQQALAAMEQQLADVTKNLEVSKMETAHLRTDLAALVAQKGAAESLSQEQIQLLKRAQDFLGEVGKIGGAVKAGSDNMTVVFVRSAMFKAPKNDILTPEGEKTLLRIVALLKKYPEFNVKLSVHGFGQPAKKEDVPATSRMARLIRETLVDKGSLDAVRVETVGSGSAEIIYPKNNPEGNRRVEVTFVKK